MNKKESIFLCNKGALEKKEGNYDKAIEYYTKAQLADFTNLDIYYNLGQIFIGLEQPQKAMKHFLIYLHLFIFENTNIDIITGKRMYKNLYDSTYDNSNVQQLYINNLKCFDYKNEYGTNIISDNMIIPEGLIRFLCISRPPLQLCVLDKNLSFYAGLSYIIDEQIIKLFNDITEDDISDIQKGLLGKQNKNVLRTTNKKNLFLVLGFLYLAINLKRIKNVFEIPDYYLNNDFFVKRDIQNFKKYLERRDSI